MFWLWRRIPQDTGTTIHATLCLLDPEHLKDFEGFDVFGLNDPPGPLVALPVYCTTECNEEVADVARALLAERFPTAVLIKVCARPTTTEQLRALFNQHGPKCLNDGFTLNWQYVVSFGGDDKDLDEAFEFAFD